MFAIPRQLRFLTRGWLLSGYLSHIGARGVFLASCFAYLRQQIEQGRRGNAISPSSIFDISLQAHPSAWLKGPVRRFAVAALKEVASLFA